MLSRLIAGLAVVIGVLVFVVGHFIGLPLGVSLVFSIGIIVATYLKGCCRRSRWRWRWRPAAWRRAGR